MLPLFQCCKQLDCPRGQTVSSEIQNNQKSEHYSKKKENIKSSPISSDIILQQKQCCEKGFQKLKVMIN